MLLSIRGLVVRYRDAVALDGVSLDVREGEVVALLGANASGKTTTLRAILGLAPVTGGRIELLGDSILGLATHEVVRKGVAVVPENRRLFPGMSVLENLLLVAEGIGSATELRSAYEEILGLFPLFGDNGRFQQPAGTLSGGEQQQVAMARALMQHPRLLLLDEPSMGMSAKLVRQNFDIVAAVAQSGIGVLMVEQNVRMALAVASSGYVLQEGRVIHSDLAPELLQSDLIQRSFLGEFVPSED